MTEERKKSTHKVEVVPVVLEKHPNADSLSIVHVWGYQVIVRTVDWTDRKLGAYIVPDSMVDVTRPEFSFLADPKAPPITKPCYKRIHVMRLRGALSQGLLLPAPEGSKLGDDVAEVLGVTRYEPELEGHVEFENPPDLIIPKYDIDDIHRYPTKFTEGEEVRITEKIDGCNSCFVWHDNRMWVKGRNGWMKLAEKSVWWRALKNRPEVEDWCKAHPDIAVFGEVYGHNKKAHYGRAGSADVLIAVFDIWDHSRFLDFDEAREVGKGLPWVPLVERGPYSFAGIKILSNGRSLMPGADHRREGVVVLPVKERADMELGRLQLKFVSDEHLEKDV